MKYIILNKWKLQGAKPHYYLKEVVEGLDLANKKLNAYGGLKDIKLYGSKSINDLIHDPRAVNPLAVNDFEKIQKILINN
jgi:hypothetical protein